MEKEPILLLIFFSFLLKPKAGENNCLSASCGPHEPEVRFPFRILGRQPAPCGFPGFDLSCNEQNKTTLRLSSSLPYIVKNISYISQVIYIDPEFCLPNRIVNVNPTGTPFGYSILDRYTFYNCSSENSSLIYPNATFPCLSSANYSVLGALTNSFYPKYVVSNCTAMKTITVPVGSNSDRRETLELTWFSPYCRSCEKEGQACRLKSDDGQTFCLSSSNGQGLSLDSNGISRSAKYGLIIGIDVSALIGIIVFACYASYKVQENNNSLNQNIDLTSSTIITQPATRTGLDRATIESYPKSVLGDSSYLPNDGGTCAICLCEYKPKETLRSIPECNHYFHSECIDDWLKLNATCPICRKRPESSTLVTPSSSTSLLNIVDSS